MKLHPKVDEYLDESNKWHVELKKLREIFLSCDLNEDLKWGSPIYTSNGTNIVGMRGFKEHFAVWFYNGALLKDPYKVLIASTENTQAMRQIRFFNLEEVKKAETVLRKYIFETLALEKAGVKYEFKKSTEAEIPAEFQLKLDTRPDLKEAFDKLTPGRQRDYCRHFSEPRQAATRESRIEKCIPQILAGLGLNDKYKC